MNNYFVILAGISYNINIADRQVIFNEASPVYSCYTQFAFERPIDINDSPGIWYLTYIDTSSKRIPLSTLIAAHEWVCKKFGSNFEPYKEELTIK